MATVQLDTLVDAQLDFSPTVSGQVRTGVIFDLPIDSDPDPTILQKAFNILFNTVGFTWGSLYQTGSNLVLQRIVVKPINADSVQFWLYYATPTGGMVPGAYIYRDSTYMVEREDNVLPGTRQIIKCSFVSTTSPQLSVPVDSTPIRFLYPLRAITISAMILGLVPPDLSNLPGRVNADVWMGLDPGYWLMTECETDTKQFTGYYTVAAKVITQIDQDWSILVILKNTVSGRDVDVAETDRENIFAPPYPLDAPTIIYPFNSASQPDSTKGIMRVCPYAAVEFGPLLGNT